MHFSGIYDHWEGIQRKKYEEVERVLGKKMFRAMFSQRKILDIGSGVGYFENFLRDRNIRADIIGMDIDEWAMKQSDMEQMVIGNGNSLPFRSGVFDGVIVFDTAHLLEEGDVSGNISRVLKENGVALLTTFFNLSDREDRVSSLKSVAEKLQIVCEFEIHGEENEYVILARKT